MPSSKPSSVPRAPSLQLLPLSGVGQDTRIDLCEIKSKIVKRTGPERAKKYFQHLERFLSSKLSKNEFDKLCLVALGRENLPLHNHLIRSVLRNACGTSGPPAINASRLGGDVSSSEHTLVPPVWDNGVALNQHVKGNRPLSRNALTQHSSLNHGDTSIRENGAPNLIDLKGYPQIRQSEHAEALTKQSRVEKVPLNFHGSVHNNGPSAVDPRETLVEDIIHHARGPVQAPLGIHFGAANFDGSRKPSSLASASDHSSVSCYELGELSDTLSLRKRMEKTAEAEGLEGVSIECANLLNNGVDVFLKQLIGSCVELVGARSQHGKLSHAALKQQLCRKLINGVSLQSHAHVQGGIIPPGTNSISMQDLKAVSELNPHLLGVNASCLLEKINSRD